MTDSRKVDAHEITPEEYDEIPELTSEDFARGDLYVGDVLVSRGRPRSANAKRLMSLRLDPEVIAHFRKGGVGWQTRINAALRRAAKLDAPHRPAARHRPRAAAKR
jgi:uncharacterized protein (DUF4415 family)